jgi:protein ImuB
VLTRLDQALGIVAEPLQPLEPPTDFAARLAFADPIVSDAALMTALEALAAELCASLAAAAMGARRLQLTLYRCDGTCARIAAGLSRPGRSSTHMLRLLREKQNGIDVGFGIDLVVLAAPVVEPLSAVQPGLEGNGRQSSEAIDAEARLIDRLAGRLGSDRVLRLLPQQSHWPERAERLQPASQPADTSPGTAAGGDAPDGRLAVQPLRPLLLLERPEPVEVVAEVPEGPPLAFRWRRSLRRVIRAEGPQRIAAEWWRAISRAPPSQEMISPDFRSIVTDEGSSRSAAARPRDYYRLEDESGCRYWVFRAGFYDDREDLRPPEWFMHGLI